MSYGFKQPSVLVPLCLYAGILLLLSITLWYVIELPFLARSAGAVGVYMILLMVSVATLVGIWWLRQRHAHHLVPRLWIVASFLSWIGITIASLLVTDVAAQYYLKLLQAPSIFFLVLLVSLRVRTVFAPRTSRLVFYTVAATAFFLTLLLTPSEHNYHLLETATGWHWVSGVGYTIIVLLGFTLLLYAVLCIPLGRRQYPTHPTLSVGPLVFTEAQQAQDVSLFQNLDQLIHRMRRRALKRGQWVYYQNLAYDTRGIVSTEPKAFTNALTTLLEYALHKNQTRAVGVRILSDARHPYIHTSISYTTNTHARLEFTTYKEHWRDLGGALTVQRDTNTRDTTLVVSFPVHW